MLRVSGAGQKNFSRPGFVPRHARNGDATVNSQSGKLLSTEHASRPQRIRLPDFTGRMQTLPDGQESWRRMGGGEDALVLGLGPGCPWQTPLAANARTVYWLEHAPILQALPPLDQRGGAGLPAHWRQVSAEAAVALARRCACYFYGPGMRLAPEFWGPLLGRVDAALLEACAQAEGAAENDGPAHGAPAGAVAPGGATAFDKSAASDRHAATAGAVVPDQPAAPGLKCAASRAFRKKSRGPVLLPGHDGQLLHQELRQALTACGLGPVLPMPEQWQACADVHAVWRELFCQGKPRLLLSVNLRGLDAEGRVFHLCRDMGVPVALWLVDNPWHVLSALRLPWWREARIFVTDASFMPELAAAGARHVHHLPLAAAPHMWRAQEAVPAAPEKAEALFVGRSAFPQKERFFAAASVPERLRDEALALLENNETPSGGPNYFWWRHRLGGAAWPGSSVRGAGLGAEICARANRARWLRTLLEGRTGKCDGTGGEERPPLRIIGDAGWKVLLPGADILPPVDYYAALPEWYARAVTLNVTSLLLPHSLSQRHFDVWAAGGVLLSDATSGLDIFAPDIADAVRLDRPEDFWPRWDALRSRPAYARELRLAWREHLRQGHEYTHRVGRICELAGIEMAAAGQDFSL
ncbi:conserved hypothetical protein [uncultured Desulfovibrio sp.]|uniref:Spore protein YkvP/CgeB glycosyl transferase-like domain-containing protein n=1 Tax=uncultured Desulfovibrio sp. TaxID=167968 RepID=A0A212L8X0_9BACT|nr:conserved hypothetical protein [uncultured Desulfovibrio sp.]VZH34428.1 conserved protein of unknown function [Desulfovibrio sp. 86]